MIATDVDQLAAALDAEPSGPYGPRLADLLAVAAELSEVLIAQPLPLAVRRRLYRRAVDQADAAAPHGLAGLVRRPSLVGAAGGVAALAAAAVAVALLRGRDHPHGGMPQAA